jgi:hypothetical protein
MHALTKSSRTQRETVFYYSDRLTSVKPVLTGLDLDNLPALHADYPSRVFKANVLSEITRRNRKCEDRNEQSDPRS